MLREPGRYDYWPLIDRIKIRWPDGARVAFWVGPNIEFYELNPPDGQGRPQRKFGHQRGDRGRDASGCWAAEPCSEAMAWQIRRHNGEMFGEQRCKIAPAVRGRRRAVEQQDHRTRTHDLHMPFEAACSNESKCRAIW